MRKWRLRTKEEDVEKFGFATRCSGCRAANRGSTAVGHSEERRKRVTEELAKLGDERIERENERWFEYLTEEEKRMKRRREETDGAAAAGTGSSQAASSSGVVAGPEIARSRGGVPIEAETRAV